MNIRCHLIHGLMARLSVGMLVPGRGAGDLCRVETSTGAFIGKDQVSAGLADWADGPGPVLHPSCSSTALDAASCGYTKRQFSECIAKP